MENSDIFKLDGHTLRVFLALCQTCSVSRTADLFAVNQSTISYTLEKLRAAFDDPLFVRAGRGIAPTEKTIALQKQVCRLVADLEGLGADNTFDPALDTRPVSIAVATPALLPELRSIHKALQTYPVQRQLDVRRLAPRSRISEILDTQDVDLAITLAGVPYPAMLNHCIYGEDDLVVFYDPAVREPIWSVDTYISAKHAAAGFGGTGPSIVESAMATEGLERDISLISPTTSMLADLMLGTDLIATMPRSLHRGAFRNLAFCAPPIDLPTLTYHMVWHRRYEHSGRNKWLRNLVLDTRDAAHDVRTAGQQPLRKVHG